MQIKFTKRVQRVVLGPVVHVLIVLPVLGGVPVANTESPGPGKFKSG